MSGSFQSYRVVRLKPRVKANRARGMMIDNPLARSPGFVEQMVLAEIRQRQPVGEDEEI